MVLDFWSLGGFKSYEDEAHLALAPLTIFAGSNSSGKSTVLQSILLIKQTLQYSAPNKSISLNGPLVRLGTFEDVLNEHRSANERHISIGWKISRSISELHDAARRPGSWSDIECRLKIEPHAPEEDLELARLQPPVTEVDFSITPVVRHPDLPPPTYRVFLSRARQRAEARFLKMKLEGKPDESEARALRFKVSDFSQGLRNEPEFFESDTVGCLTEHFLPSAILLRYNEASARASKYVTQVFARVSRLPGVPVPRDIAADENIPEFVFDILADAAVEVNKEVGEKLKGILAPLRRDGHVRFNEWNHVSSQDKDLRLFLLQEFVATNRTRRFYEQVVQRLPSKNALRFSTSRPVREASRAVHDFFATDVSYLGPLRDDPKPIYPLRAFGNPTDVGVRGENTAAVLDLHKNVPVEFVAPDCFTQDTAPSPALALRLLTKMPLLQAVEVWLRYMEVASDVETKDRGKMGHELRVRPRRGSKFRDLTNVGVGVSQLLPIVVMGLLCGRGSVLIIEQPELHLHPKVQAKLADFLLSLSLSGRQLLVETHGEYLVERFRLRIAQAPGDSLVDTVGTYFITQELGDSIVRPVRISKYGAIPDWPDDFFDQSQKEADAILMAAARKRLAERGPRK